MRPRITVVGGANLDIVGIPTGRFARRDSNPGHVRSSPGGVARNIAENLARLGAEVRLVTAFGEDDVTEWLMAECVAAGIDTSFSVRAHGVPGSRYLAVLDGSGDLAAAVNDMRALDALTPDSLDPAAFAGADAVVVDTNMHGSTVAHVAELAGRAPLLLDPVSTAKAMAAQPILGRLSVLKANLREAEELSGAAGPDGAASRLLEAGIRYVVITMGPAGVLCASREETFRLPAPRADVVNVTGAGDAFTAGAAWGLALGMPFRQIAEWASALSAITLECERTVCETITADAVRARMEASR
ncbi:MAG: carbohydrate kinase family protein [Coriobacteriia bacterium]|jgi:pseudouridine kinase